MTLLLAIGLTTLVVARNADPSTPEAVEDAQTLVAEIEALNGYLATTNELLAGAIESAEQLNAAAQAQLAGLSAKLADAEPRVGQARGLLGSQLSGATRTELDNAQQQLQSLRGTLTERSERLAQQELETVKRDVAGLEDRVGVATGQGSNRASATEARIAALESKQSETDQLRAQVQAEADRLRAEAELLRAAVQAQGVAIQAQRDAIQAQRQANQAQRQRAQELAAQIRQLRLTVTALRRIVDRLSSRP